MSGASIVLSDDAIVYRLLTRRAELSAKGVVLYQAFVRREPPPKDTQGISVYFGFDLTERDKLEAAPMLLNGVKAIGAVKVADIRNLGLDVVPDPALE